MEGLVADHLRHGIGQLDLAARPFALMFKHAHHLRLQDVAPGDDQVRRGIGNRRLFNQALHLGQLALRLAGIDHAIARNLFVRHFKNAQQVATDAFIFSHHLRHAAGRAMHELVGQEDRKRFIADNVARAPYGMAQPHRLLLADIGAVAWAKTGRLEDRDILAAIGHRPLKLISDIEMVLDRALAATGDEDHLLDPCLTRLINRILNQRPIDHR